MNLKEFDALMNDPNYNKIVVDRLLKIVERLIKIIIKQIPTIIIYLITLYFVNEIYYHIGFEKTIILLLVGAIVRGSRKDA